ncbi:MAG: hypothetical protein HQ564_06085 [Candidatus Saganbacteria bacterium]|nr:hypothetical protein [Candidatus Saganbacteria bacterium]
MLIKLDGIRKWSQPVPGKVIGSSYRFENSAKAETPRVIIEKSNPLTFDLDLDHYTMSNCYVKQIQLRQIGGGPVGRVAWDISLYGKPKIDVISLVHPDYYGTGIAEVLGNIIFRSFFEHEAEFESIETTRTLSYSASSLRILGWLSKFGIDCYELSELEKFILRLHDGESNLSIGSVRFRPETFFLKLVLGRGVCTEDREYKIFLRGEACPKESYQALLNNRSKIERLVRRQQAVVGLPMLIDPEKVEIMREYAKALPRNPF